MNIKKYFILFVLLLISFSFLSHGYCYWANIHRKITLHSIDQSSLNDSLIKIGLPNGVYEIIGDEKGIIKNISIWLADASEKEDDFLSSLVVARYLNHFYNPITNKGLIDPPFLGTSSLVWASEDGHNEWTWKLARDYLYESLTKITKAERNNSIARSIRALGQVAHLVQDLAVPSHVRNDAHPTGDPYEIYTHKNISKLDYSSSPFPYWNLSISPYAPKQFWDLEAYNGNISYSTGYIGLAEYTNANFGSLDTIFSEVLFSFDSHYFPYPKYSSSVLYEEIDPETNKKTKYFKIIKDSLSIDHFAIASRFHDIYEGFQIFQRLFIGFNDKCHYDYASKLIPRAVGYSAGLLNYFFRGDINLKYEAGTNPGYVITNNSDENMSGTFQIFYDDKSDNRTELWKGTLAINAHGKSGRVYFQEPDLGDAKEPGKYILVFRGTMGNEKDAVAGRVTGRLLEITPPSAYVYSIIDGSINPQQFTRVRAKIRNATGEEIKNGTLQAVAKYLKRTDYEPDLSEDPPTPETREADFSYSVSEQIPITSLSATNPAEFTFNLTSNPIPAGITDLYLQIIFTGTVGDETDTASAIGTKDLSEPTHHVFWNLSDMFSLNGQLYTAEEIRNDPDLSSLVDLDDDGILNEVDISEPYIDPVEINFKIAYFGTNPPAGPVLNAATVDKLAAGRHIRLVMLLDRLENNYLRLTWSDNIYPESYYDFVFTGAINQEVHEKENGQEKIVFRYTPPTEFRYWLGTDGVTENLVRQHFSQGILSCMPQSSPHGCSYPDEEAIPANPEPVPATILVP